MGFFSKIVSTIKVLGKGKAMLEAIDDDVNLDGKPELDNLKDKYHIMKDKVLDLFEEAKGFVLMAGALVNHVARAGDKEDK